MSDHPLYPCDGCDLPDATEVLWVLAPLGRCCIHVHRDRACAEAARARRGGGKILSKLGPAKGDPPIIPTEETSDGHV